MNVLIIPCRDGESPAELYELIYESTKICEDIMLGGKGLAEHIRKEVTWANLTKESPYVEIKVKKEPLKLKPSEFVWSLIEKTSSKGKKVFQIKKIRWKSYVVGVRINGRSEENYFQTQADAERRREEKRNEQ